VIEVNRGGRAIPLTIQFTAVREAREFVATVPGATSGLIFGTYSPDALTIDHVAARPAAQRPIGIFRVQSEGWPALTEPDRQKLRDLAPAGGLVLVLRTLHQRPWPATLFVVEPLATAGADLPLAEFPFDEYLLRNGWLTDLAPPLPPAAPPRKRTTLRLLLGLAAILLLGAGGAAAYRWAPSQWRTLAFSPAPTADRAAPVPEVPAVEGTTLGLKLSPTAGHLELSWNRQADAVRLATSGSVSIRNGPVTRVLTLNPEQLREGRILYLPMSGVDVDMRLEVVTASGRTEAESVQLVSFNTAPAVPMTALTPPRPAPRPAPRRPAANAEPDEPDPEPFILHRAVKPFRADSLTSRTKSAANAAPETPSVAAPGVADVNLRAIGTTAAPAPAPPVPGANSIPPPGHQEEAQLLSGRLPEYPSQAREDRVTGMVELEITIGADGRVKSTRILNGDPRLREAAIIAVRKWIYKPGMLNGKPVQSQRQVLLNFKP
jgi:protein TonB